MRTIYTQGLLLLPQPIPYLGPNGISGPVGLPLLIFQMEMTRATYEPLMFKISGILPGDQMPWQGPAPTFPDAPGELTTGRMITP